MEYLPSLYKHRRIVPWRYERAKLVATGTVFETDPGILEMAANILLNKELTARSLDEKFGILSPRQIDRRKAREVYLGDGMDEIDMTRIRPMHRYVKGETDYE